MGKWAWRWKRIVISLSVMTTSAGISWQGTCLFPVTIGWRHEGADLARFRKRRRFRAQPAKVRGAARLVGPMRPYDAEFTHAVFRAFGGPPSLTMTNFKSLSGAAALPVPKVVTARASAKPAMTDGGVTKSVAIPRTGPIFGELALALAIEQLPTVRTQLAFGIDETE